MDEHTTESAGLDHISQNILTTVVRSATPAVISPQNLINTPQFHIKPSKAQLVLESGGSSH